MVVSDTSPLNYLVLIQSESILPQLYREIWIPPAVQAELQNPATPTPVRRFIVSPPPWLRIGQLAAVDRSSLSHLDEGEIEAILLAEQMKARALLIDERAGAKAAQLRGVNITGTLGVLDKAAKVGLINLRRALENLRQTTFRTPARIVKLLLDTPGPGE